MPTLRKTKKGLARQLVRTRASIAKQERRCRERYNEKMRFVNLVKSIMHKVSSTYKPPDPVRKKRYPVKRIKR